VNLEKVANLIYFFQAPIDRNMNEDKQILIVEDDLSLGYLLMESLQTEGYKVQLSRNGKTGWDHYQNGNYDLCILDVMMPEMDGFNLAKKINTQKIKTPFLFLTAKDSKEDILEGFRLGADDYITKPFDEEEFLCRINVVLRRNEKDENGVSCNSPVQIGDYLFDYSKQELNYKGQIKRITEKENEVLKLLIQHKGQILKRADAVEIIYGKRDYFLGRSFDVFISRIRKLLNQDSRIEIENVFKVGFILHTHDS